MIFSKRFFLSIFLFILTEACLAAPAGVDWQWVNPTPQGNPFNAVAYNSTVGASVAVGDRGNVVVSTDGGVNWAIQTSNTTQNLNAIYTDANTSFIAVGDNGTIVTEAAAGAPPQLSGIWADFTDGSLTANLNGITKGNVTGSDLFVAVGDNGAVLTNDGSSNVWAVVSVPAGIGNLTAVVWSGTIFVAVSDNGTIIASPNGTSWTKENFTSGAPSAPNGFRAVTWSGSQFVAVGDSGLIETSVNGANWGQQTPPVSKNMAGVSWNGSVFVITASLGTVFTSADGINWSFSSTFTTLSNLRSVIWDGSQFIVAGDGATLLTSLNGTSWTQRYPQAVTTNTLFSVKWSPTLSEFIAVSTSGALLTSLDGLAWTSHSLPTVFFDIADNGALLVAAGLDGKPYTSTDGINWTVRATGNTNGLNAVAWGGAKFVAVGNSGTILTSPDGVTWATPASGTVKPLNGIVWDGTQFVTVGNSGTILTSPDGVTWTPRSSGVPNSLLGIVNNGGNLVVVGSTGTILTSPGGVTWTSRTSGATQTLNEILWDGAQYVIVGQGGTVLTSASGLAWTAQDSGTGNVLFGIAWNGTRLAAVGSDGAILTSMTGYTVGGSVSGLAGGSLVLQNNNANDLVINADGVFTFPSFVANGDVYDVTVLTQPVGQLCTVSNSNGTVSSADINNISISCVVTYSIGGNITGLNGTIVLQNNAGDDLTITSDGSFSFATPIVNGAFYQVSILSSPANQTCNMVSSQGSINTADITSVSISCSDNPASTGGGGTTTPASSGGGGAFNFYLLMLLPGLLLAMRGITIRAASVLSSLNKDIFHETTNITSR